MFNYFIHPSNMAKIDDVLRMRMTEGSAGYGIYMQLLELLRDCNDYKTKYDPAVLAWGIHESEIDRLERVCRDYNLFTIDESGYLFSPWLRELMAEHEEKREKLSRAGRASAAARAKSAEQSEDTPEQVSNNVPTTLNTPPQHRSSNVERINEQTKENKKNKENQIQPTHGVKRYVVAQGWKVEDFSDVCREKAPLLDPSTMESLAKSPAGYNFAAVVECALYFKLTPNQTRLLMAVTHNGKIGSAELMELLRAKNHCKESNFMPTFPMNYILQNIHKAINP